MRDELPPYLSLKLVARAADIGTKQMQRIADDLAKGRRTAWLGAAVEVRVHNRGKGRHRDIVTASLPDVLRAELASNRLRFLVSAEHPEPGADLTSGDFRLLHRAAQSGVAADQFDAIVGFLCDGGRLTRSRRSRFDLIMDRLFGHGFRDPELIEVGADYRDFLDERRRALGFDDATFAAILSRNGGTGHDGRPKPELLTGPDFLRVLAYIHDARGVRLPRLPARSFVDRRVVGMIHGAVYALNLSLAQHLNVLVTFGGGCMRTRDLDERGAWRVLSHYMAHGYIAPGAPLPAPGLPGYVTQPQANLITKLLRDVGFKDAAGMRDHLGQAVAPGGLLSLTSAGAGRLIDQLLASNLALREAAAWDDKFHSRRDATR